MTDIDTIEKIAQEIGTVSEWLGGLVNVGQSSPEEPPEPASQHDYDLAQASNTLHHAAERLRALPSSQQSEQEAVRYEVRCSLSMEPPYKFKDDWRTVDKEYHDQVTARNSPLVQSRALYLHPLPIAKEAGFDFEGGRAAAQRVQKPLQEALQAVTRQEKAIVLARKLREVANLQRAENMGSDHAILGKLVTEQAADLIEELAYELRKPATPSPAAVTASKEATQHTPMTFTELTKNCTAKETMMLAEFLAMLRTHKTLDFGDKLSREREPLHVQVIKELEDHAIDKGLAPSPAVWFPEFMPSTIINGSMEKDMNVRASVRDIRGGRVALAITQYWADRIADALDFQGECAATGRATPEELARWDARGKLGLEELESLPPPFASPAAPKPDEVSISLSTLRHWRSLVDDNPRDLAPRMDARIAAAMLPPTEITGDSK